MPWGWILSALLVPAGLAVLALALFHVRFRASWGGAWESLDSRQEGSFRLEYGFPGFMRKWEWDEEYEGDERVADAEKSTPSAQAPDVSAPSRAESSPATESSAPTPQEHGRTDETKPTTSTATPSAPLPRSPSRSPSPKKPSRNRWRRALFRFVTDGKAWRLVARHGYRTARGLLTLLKPRVAIAVGHPDPVLLGRVAACWHAAAPLTAASRATLELRFQDRRPTFAIRAEGGFSALSFVLFGILNASTFPWIGLSRRAWHSWWRHELEGWRKWAYRSLQG